MFSLCNLLSVDIFRIVTGIKLLLFKRLYITLRIALSLSHIAQDILYPVLDTH